MSGVAGRFDLAAGLAAFDRELFVSSSGIVIAFDGRLDNREELGRPRPTRATDAAGGVADAEYVSEAYDHAGARFASCLNGDFVLALFDPSRRQLILARDVMGTRRLHYTQVAGRLLFASEIKSLLAHPGVSAKPDEDALADLVLDRSVDGHRTCFQGIYSVPPGHLLLATPDTISLRQHWMFDPTREVRYRTFDEYAECFRTLFEQAVRRRMRSTAPIAVSVSGGVDSSAIFCQAAALSRRDSGLPAVCGISMTFPAGSLADEQRFLDEIDAAFGTAVMRLPIAELRLLQEADRIVGHLEMPDLVWDAHSQIFERARGAGCSVLLDGYYGDQVLFPRGYLIDLAYRGRWLRIRHDLREFAAWMTDVEPNFFPHEFWNALFRSMLPRPLFQTAKEHATRHRASRYPPWYTKTFVDRLLGRQLTRFGPTHYASRHAEECYRNATAGHYLFHVQRHSAAAAVHGVEIAYPFRDRDLVAFMMAIPGDVASWRGIPKGLPRQALVGILPQPIRDRRWKADFTPFTNQAALRDYDTIGRLLTKDSLAVAAGFVDGTLIEEAVRNYRTTIAADDSAEAGWRLTEVAALELWLRHFFEQALL